MLSRLSYNTRQRIPTHFWFCSFLFVHLLIWTLVPIYTRHNLPMDAIEGSLWGHQLEWGYDKNPFLNGWLTALAVHWGGNSGWLIYLFSQLSVVVCFWAVWRLASLILAPAEALASVLLLEGLQYYNFHAIDFNDNNLELSLWALTIYFFYQAMRRATLSPWLLTALWAGLGMMAKYYTAALLAAMVLFLLYEPRGRQQLKSWPIYASIALFLLMLIPHTLWLFHHQFITVQYVFDRTSSERRWLDHLFFPAQFAWQQIEVCLPALGIFLLLFLGQSQTLDNYSRSPSPFDRRFLLAMGLGPFALTLLLALSLGIKLRAGWGMPLLSLWGILLMAFLPPRLTQGKLYGLITGVFLLMITLAIGYRYALIHAKEDSSANFPGKLIANTVTTLWHQRYTSPLAYVAGPRWINGNIQFYSPDHPSVFSEWDPQHAPWINQQQLTAQGAIFAWNISNHETLPEAVKQAFPQLGQPMILTFHWLNNPKLAEIKIGIAILPPAAKPRLG